MTMFLLAYIVTFLGQLLFWGADTYFFSAVILSKQLLIWSKFCTDQLLLLRRGSFLGHLVFQNSYYLRRQICSEYQYLQKSFFFEADFSAKHQNFQNSCFFNNLLPTFWNSKFFGKAIEDNICFFRRATFSE